jgi:ribosomal protein S12 methylthiotransferase accessory factor
MVITHEGGVKFVAQIRQHRLTVDQPLRGGGDDSAPMPLELLGASLGTCVALYVQQFCHARGLKYEGMRVEVDPQGAQGRIGRFDVRVILPEPLPPQYERMLERVAKSCPAHNTLAHGAEVAVEIQHPAQVG